MIELSKRLRTIADYITPGSRLADIGSDHALLPIYMLQSGRAPAAIAGELNPGPLQAARKAAAGAGLTGSLSVRQGDGLAVLEPGEADTVTIAGMGGSLMSGILESGRAAGRLEGVSELVLQPNIGEDAVRSWLAAHDWYLAGESIVEEDGKTYEVLHAVRRADAAPRNAELYNGAFLGLPYEEPIMRALLLRMGPHLLRQPSRELFGKWTSELHKMERICRQLESSDLPESAAKRMKIRKEMSIIEEVLRCLPTVKPSLN